MNVLNIVCEKVRQQHVTAMDVSFKQEDVVVMQEVNKMSNYQLLKAISDALEKDSQK